MANLIVEAVSSQMTGVATGMNTMSSTSRSLAKARNSALSSENLDRDQPTTGDESAGLRPFLGVKTSAQRALRTQILGTE